MEEINNFIIFLKQFEVLLQVTHFVLPAEYHTISKNGKNSSKYWNWIIKGLIELKQNLKTVQLYIREPLHKLWFIAKAPDDSCIIGP